MSPVSCNSCNSLPIFVNEGDANQPKDWTRHVDPRDRSNRTPLSNLEQQYPVLFQGKGPPGHNY